MPKPKKLTRKLGKCEFYCVACRKRVKVDCDDIRVKRIRNRRVGPVPALKSRCNKCDTNLTRFIKHSAEKQAKRYYG